MNPTDKLTPEIADKIWKQIEKANYDKQVSKDAVLQHLKQLKAQMGKEKAKYGKGQYQYIDAIDACMEMIDKKITKIKNQ